MFRPEKNEAYFVSLTFLDILGQIPSSNDISYLKRFYMRLAVARLAALLFTTVGPIVHMIMSVLNDSNANVTENISITLNSTGGALVGILFTLKYQEWSEFFGDLTDTEKFGKPADYDSTVKRLNFRGKVYFSLSLSVTVSYALSSWFASIHCDETHQTGIREICPTYVPIWLPFGANNVPFGSLIFMLQVFFVGFFSGTIFLIICFIFYESTELLKCQSNNLEHNIRKVFDGTSPDEMHDKMRYCIKYHVHILSLTSRLCSLMKTTAGHTSLIAAAVLGCAANELTSTKPLAALVEVVAWLASFFIFCYSGQVVKDMTLSIGDAVLESDWWRADATTMKDIKFALMRTQKPIYFEALPFGILDHSFFLMMIRAGYSYFTLLRNKM